MRTSSIALSAVFLSVSLFSFGCTNEDPVAPFPQNTEDASAETGISGADVLPLPNGFQPEGIAFGHGPFFYVGSLADGSIYRGELRRGTGEILIQGDGRPAVGLEFDGRTQNLFVAGGESGTVSVYNTRTAATLDVLELTTEESTFINDLAVAGQSVYATDSSRPVLYRIDLEKGGQLPADPVVEEVPLGKEFHFVPGSFNANGIVSTPGGQWLLIVNSTTGHLYRVDPDTGEAVEVDLGGETLMNGDGMLLLGRTLYVVQNSQNRIAVVELDSSYTEGTVVDSIEDPAFRVPTTIDRFGNSIYAVNARFDTPPTEDTEYEVVRVRLPIQ